MLLYELRFFGVVWAQLRLAADFPFLHLLNSAKPCQSQIRLLSLQMDSAGGAAHHRLLKQGREGHMPRPFRSPAESLWEHFSLHWPLTSKDFPPNYTNISHLHGLLLAHFQCHGSSSIPTVLAEKSWIFGACEKQESIDRVWQSHFRTS